MLQVFILNIDRQKHVNNANNLYLHLNHVFENSSLIFELIMSRKKFHSLKHIYVQISYKQNTV